MTQVLCFGELLLRLSPQLNGEWISQNRMPVYIGGAELNVATALARWGVPVSYFTALPDHYLSREIIHSLREKKIGTNKISLSGSRIGTYYLPQGADLKNAGVIYDRMNSSFAELKPGDIHWDDFFSGISWFHFSAISPALSQQSASVCKAALVEASSRGITISVDLNFRSRLWQYGKKPIEIMPSLVEHCHVVMGNIWSADALLGIEVDHDIHDKKSKKAYLEHAARTSEKIMTIFPKVIGVANTFRFQEGEGIKYYAALDSADGQNVSDEFSTQKVIDQVGSGDTFMAGLIYGFFNHHQPKQIINFAAAAAFNKLFILGDATTSSVEEIKNASLKYA